MSKEEFVSYSNDILNKMNQRLLLDEDKVCYVKNYIYFYPNNEEVLIFKKNVMYYYKDDQFINCVDYLRYISNNFVIHNYCILHEVSRYFPLKNDRHYYLKELFEIPELSYFTIISYYSFFKDEENIGVDEKAIDYFKFCVKNYRDAIKATKNIYGSLYGELNEYNTNYQNASEYEVYEEFVKYKKEVYENGLYLNDPQIVNQYKNKKLGNAGELFTFEQLKNQKNAVLVSRDYGDGFGYDIYYSSEENNKTYENLIEVKTTIKSMENDCFTLSDNEEKLMKKASKENNTNYYIYRVFYDKTLRTFTNLICLIYDGKNLISINNDDIAYTYDEVSKNYVITQKSKLNETENNKIYTKRAIM